MTENLKNKIKYFENDLFYNNTGTTDAYKLGIKHLSSAPMFGYGKIICSELILERNIFIVNFEKEEIEEIKENIKVIPLKLL